MDQAQSKPKYPFCDSCGAPSAQTTSGGTFCEKDLADYFDTNIPSYDRMSLTLTAAA